MNTTSVAAARPRGQGRGASVSVLLAAAVWLAFLAWMRPLTLPDEGRYVGVAWEMLRSGDLAVPLLDGMPYFHKPPLFYWLAALSMRAFGLHEWAARLPSLLLAWAAVAGLYFFARRYRDAVAARTAAAVLATTPLFYGGAQFANLDMSVAGMICLCVLAGADTVLRRAHGRPWRAMALATAACAALAVLAKGLIGIVLPGGALALWLLWRRDGRGLRALLWPPAIVVFAAVAVPWFWMMQARFPGFFHYFFVYQHFQRFAQAGFNNAQPFWFYLPVLAGLALPWSLWSGGMFRRRFWCADDPDGLRRLMAIWLGVVLAFFSLPASKLVGYILPALPPLAFLVGEVLRDIRQRATPELPPGRLVAASLAAAALVCVVAVNIAAGRPRGSASTLAPQVAARMQPGDVTASLHAYPFDLGFYTRSRTPFWVVDEWDSPAIAQRDNWRKELYDAGEFAPAVAQEVLVTAQALRQRLCAAAPGSRFWLWGSLGDEGLYPVLSGAHPQFSEGKRRVWLLEGGAELRQAACDGTPTAGSPGTSTPPAPAG
ncbi:ArnT family glycosyltransferase [Bordetella genomosp. 13]|uniref:ArnT family glycosyltransferase n=1 Tax=Bordetella genomosp. 13 TaxID=463040 RepID=UPI00119E0BD7|nr:glycosyltransferase family 39 protein [Bordetella genomosp. 13]